MITKQKRMLGIVVLMASILVVVIIISVVPFTFVVNGGGNEDYTEIPIAPTFDIILPNPNTDGSVELSWSKPAQTQYFELYRFRGFGWFYMARLYTTSYTDNNVADGITYKYKVIAGNTLGESLDSNVVSVVIDIYEEPIPPDSPVLCITVNSPSTDGEIVLKWDFVSNADDYGVYRSKNDGSFDFLEKIDENYYDDLVLESGDYSYRVKAGNEAGKSDFSNTESITVQLAGVPNSPVMNELTYELVEDTIQIYLDWEEVFCDSYTVYRSIGGAEYEPLEEGLNSTSYSEVLIEVGVYMYKVSAVNMFGESERSAYVSIEITEDGMPTEPPVDYIVPIVVILVLGALAVATIILVKKKKR